MTDITILPVFMCLLTLNYGDKAYDAQERVIDKLREKNCQVVIPSKSSRIQPLEYDKHLYKARHLIENFFAKT